MAITEVQLEVHTPNPRWGMPLCWNPRDAITPFAASYFEDDVTCRKCIKLLEE